MSDSSLQTARLHSLGVLVVAYVGLSFSTTHHERLSTLWRARQAVAGIVLLQGEQSRSVPGLGYVGLSQMTGAGGRPREEAAWRVVVTRGGNSRWAVVSTAGSEGAYESLRGIAADFGVEDVPVDDVTLSREYVSVFRRIEARAGEGLEVPGTGVRFFGAKAVWACVLFVTGLLVVLRDRLQHVLRDPKVARGERWIAVDGHAGLERGLATLELLGLLVAPTALTSGLVLVITSQLIADGADTSVLSDVVTGALALTLLIVNVWLSVTTVAHVLDVRRRRLELPPLDAGASPTAAAV